MAPRLTFAEALDELIGKYLDLEYDPLDISEDLDDAHFSMEREYGQREHGQVNKKEEN